MYDFNTGIIILYLIVFLQSELKTLYFKFVILMNLLPSATRRAKLRSSGANWINYKTFMIK